MTTCCPPAQSSATTEAPAVKPRFVVHSDKENYSVQIDVPGVSKDGVNISLDSDILSVRAKRNSSAAAGWKTLHRELSNLDFHLRLKLNVPVDESRLTAKLDAGVLTVSLPVKEAAKPRRIEVN